MRTHTHNDRMRRMQPQLNARAIIDEARKGILRERREFEAKIVRHYMNGKHCRIGIISPHDGTGDRELFVNGRRIGRFLAAKEYLVFSVHNDASPK